MSRAFSLGARCRECEDLVREWLEAKRADFEDMHQRLLETARSSGRKPQEMRNVWLSSIASMPDGEMRAVVRAFDARATQARRRWRDHEAATGHSVSALGTAIVLGYSPPPGAGSSD